MKKVILFEQFITEAKGTEEIAAKILGELDKNAQLYADYIPKEALGAINKALKKNKSLIGKDAELAAKQIRMNLEDIGILSNTLSPFDVEMIIMNHLNESLVNEATTSWAKMMKGVKASESGPWSLVAIENNKVVGQKIDIRIKDMLPAHFEAMRKEFPKAKIHIEDGTGMVVWNESIVNEANDIKVGSFVRYKKDKDFTGGKVLSIKDDIVEISNWDGSTTELPLKDLEYVKSWNESLVNEATMQEIDKKVQKFVIKNANDYEYSNQESAFQIYLSLRKLYPSLIKESLVNEAKFKVGDSWEWNHVDGVKIITITDIKSNGDVVAKTEGESQDFIVRDANKYLKKKVNESTVNEAKELDRDALMNLLETKYKIKTVRTSEEFNGQTEGIWVAGDNGEEMSGNKIFDYYNSSAKYANGILKQVRAAVEKTGWWFEWNDPGTLIIWPKNL